MTLEITIPTDKEIRVKTAFDAIYNDDMTKAKMEALITEWLKDNVRRYEMQQAINEIIIEDVF